MLDNIIRYCFYLLFAVTPMIWLRYNSELFEFNKMMFVYLMTIVITFSWLIKIIHTKLINIKRTQLDIPILLFLLANILSTIFSTDAHVSIFGYYSRLNGGLLSIISYTLLYFAFVSNFTADQVIKFLKIAVWSGLTVSLYAIPEHFGFSPSCLILHQELNASCWVQDVQARVFATLGQPNWLAAYLAMLIFPAIYFALTAKTKLHSIFYILNSTFLYLAFTFTYSRGATFGFLAGLIVFIIAYLRFHLEGGKLKLFGIITLLFVLVNILFGSALTNFQLIKKYAAAPRTAITSSSTQLENGGTESGKIRLIVWQGAWEIFKHYPIFGSGVETFAYAYYQFRPVSHNLVSEWDFLYNKAHNEYLNYLSNTGIVGFGTYISIIIVFIVYSIRYIVCSKKDSKHTTYYILHTSLLASYTSYLVQNIFSFSVVIIAVFFYLFPVMSFLSARATTQINLPTLITFFKHKLVSTVFYLAITFIFLMLFVNTIFYWTADQFFAKGSDANEIGSPGIAHDNLSWAVLLNRNEPLYQSELGFAAAGVAVALNDTDATSSAEFAKDAFNLTEKVIKEHSKNTSYLKTAVRTYYLLSPIDKKYIDKALESLEKTIALSPTDPKLTYNKAVILGQEERVNEAIAALEKTIELKPNYRDANFTLGLFYFQKNERQKALEQMKKVLKIIPSDAEAQQKLKMWQ